MSRLDLLIFIFELISEYRQELIKKKLVLYKTNNDLPVPVQKHLPKQAQDIYSKAFNDEWYEHKNPQIKHTKEQFSDELFHKAAWDAVEEKYEKRDYDKWYLKK